MKDRIIDSLTLQQYLEGTLDPRRMHELEKQALEDEFLADALEGYTYVIEPAEKLSILQQRLADRVLAQEANKKAFSVSVQRLSIASAAGVMFLLAVILFWMNGYKVPEVDKRVEVNLSAQPAVKMNTAKISKQTAAIATGVTSPVFALAKQSLSRSEPESGWNEYIKYIHTHIPKPGSLKEGVKDLIISFRISPAGVPEDLKVLGGISDQYSNEVIRLIKDGPLWKPVDNKEVKVLINFKK